MLRIEFVTLFPEMVLGALDHSMMKRARENGRAQFAASNPRDFTKDAHRTVDDNPYGGGAGMLMLCEPVWDAVRALEPDDRTAIVLTDPCGGLFRQRDAIELSERSRIIFLCGHYEGFDDRIRTLLATHVFSLGDFVLTGGELPALTMADSIVRLLPGVLGSADSLAQDSFADGVLSAPQYTRPEEFQGLRVPDVLRSGDHEAIWAWKRGRALHATRRNRPDLMAVARLEKRDADMLSSGLPDEGADAPVRVLE